MSKLHDPKLPTLVQVSDASTVIPRIRELVAEQHPGYKLKGIRAGDARYRPGVDYSSLYELRFTETATGRSCSQYLTGRLFNKRSRAARARTSLSKSYEPMKHGILKQAVFEIPDLSLLLYAFPIDPALPAMLSAMDEACLQDELNQSLSHRGILVHKASIDIVRYVPGIRGTFACKVETERQGEKGTETWYAKMSRGHDPAQLFAKYWMLWQASKQQLNMPVPICHVDALKLMVISEVSGGRLLSALRSHEDPEFMRETGREIALLHSLTPPLTRKLERSGDLSRIDRITTALSDGCPELAKRFRHVQQKLKSALAGAPQPKRLIHGDLHVDNVLIHEGRPGLIDFDNVAWGEPYADLAKFTTTVRRAAYAAEGTFDAYDEQLELLLEAYEERCPMDRRRLATFEASSELYAALGALRLQHSDWREQTERRLDQAEAKLHLVETTKSSSPAQRQKRRKASLSESKKWALDGRFMQAQLATFVRKRKGFCPIDCTVQSTKKLEGFLRIHYDLPGADGRQASAYAYISQTKCLQELRKLLKSLKNWTRDCDVPLLVPQEIRILGPIQTLLLDLPHGHPLHTLINSDAAPQVFVLATEALAHLHSVPIPKGITRQTAADIEGLTERWTKLAKRCPSESAMALRLIEQAKAAVANDESQAVTLLTIDLRQIVHSAGAVGFKQAEALGCAHPLLSVARLLNLVAYHGIQQGRPAEAESLVDRMRDRYLALTASTGDLRSFETLDLLQSCAEGFEESLAPEGLRPLLELAQQRSIK